MITSNFKKLLRQKSFLSSHSIWVQAFLGGNIYALWAGIYPLIVLNPRDSIVERYLIQIPIMIPILFYKKLKLKRRAMELLFILLLSVLIIYHVYLTYINGTHPIYIAGTTLALTAMQLLLPSFVAFIFVAFVSIFSVLIASFLHFVPENIFWILSTLTTLLFGGLMLYIRIKFTNEMIESKNLIEEQLIKLTQTQNELDEQRFKSLHASKMAALGEMAAGIAHEINNPLQIIQGQASVLERMSKDQNINLVKIAEISKKINATVDRIGKIVKGLKNFSAGDEHAHFELVELGQLIDTTLEICHFRFSHSDIKLEVSDYEKSFILRARPIQLSQVLINLLNNAHDAIIKKDNPWVKLQININKDEKILYLKVIDCGTGISPEIESKLFTPFFTTKGPKNGTGLGLSISRRIVEAHGGELFIDKTNGNTAFIMKIPVNV
jgi:signal transduction histidine kinase